MDKDDIIDATRRGGPARFMNHCCEPCAYARVITLNNSSSGAGNNSGGGGQNGASLTSAAAVGEIGEAAMEDKHIVIIAARDIQVLSKL